MKSIMSHLVWILCCSCVLALGCTVSAAAAAVPADIAKLTTIDETQPFPARAANIMANSEQLAKKGYLLEAANLRATLLDHPAQGAKEPYEVKPLGEFWGIKMGAAQQTGAWKSLLDWYRQAGAYRALISSYEKVLRDPYGCFRNWEIVRHRETLAQYRRQLDTVFIEQLSAPGAFFVDKEMRVTFDVVNTWQTARESGPIAYTVHDEVGTIVASGTVPGAALAGESRTSFSLQPKVDRTGQFTLALQGNGLAASTTFSFTALSRPTQIGAAGGELVAARDAHLLEGARREAVKWSRHAAVVTFPGKARFELDLAQDAVYYLQLTTQLHEAYERTTWKVWIDGKEQTPSGMHGSGPIQFVHTAVSARAGGSLHETLWRVPFALSRGTHTLDIALTLDQQLESIRLLPAITDKVAVKQVRCAAPFGMFYPEEQIDLTMVLENRTDAPLTLSGEAIYGLFRQRSLGGWHGQSVGQLCQMKTYAVQPVAPITLPARGTVEVPITYNPGEMGHIGVTLRLTDGTGMFLGMGADYARIFRPVAGFRRDSFFLCEMRDVRTVEFAARLGFKWGRWGRGDDFFAACRKHGIYNILVIMGSDKSFLPGGTSIGTDSLPSYGALKNFEDYVFTQVNKDKDVIGAVNFFNEPWEGKTYWGYGARGDQYRRALQALYRGVKRADPTIPVLANDDSHNVRWNILAEPGMEQYIDGASIHYGGIKRQEAPYFRRLGKQAVNTEFWYGESADDTQVVTEGLLHLMHGYSRVNSFIPFWGGNTSGTVRPRSRIESINGKLTYTDLGTKDNPYDVGSIAVVHNAMAHFLEDTSFTEVLNPIGTPWIFTFTGKETKKNTQVAVLIAHVGVGFPGDQARSKWHPYKDEQLRSFVPAWNVPNAPGLFRIPDAGKVLQAYDILGNPLGERQGKLLVVPVADEPVYLTYRGSYRRFADILHTGTTRAQRPYELTFYDFTQPLSARPSLQVKVRNLYPQLIAGTLRIEAPEGFSFATTSQPIPALKHGQEVTLVFPMTAATANMANEYLFTAVAETRDGERAALSETLSVSTAVYGTIKVDGILDDWKTIGAVSQYLSSVSKADTAYQAQNPFAQWKDSDDNFFAEFATAWDQQAFYFMARVHDPTFTWELSNFKDFERYKFFPYPNDYLYRSASNAVSANPRGVYINIQGIDKGKGYHRYPEDVYDPTDWRYRMGMFRNTDYDIVAYQTRFGPEMMRYRKDDFFYIHPLPANTDFMRLNCQVPGNLLSINFDEATGDAIYEGAIPWSEMEKITPVPGKELKLGWMVRRSLTAELKWTVGRSVSVLNAAAFEPEYTQDWSIETPWGLYKP